jgi:hypothetical protein
MIEPYIFGAICPETGTIAGSVLPWCNTEAMSLHLAETAARVTPGKHCALLVDQAGWHMSERLIVPANITIMPLPAKCPELNPVENIWQFLRDTGFCNGPLVNPSSAKSCRRSLASVRGRREAAT